MDKRGGDKGREGKGGGGGKEGDGWEQMLLQWIDQRAKDCYFHA